MFPKISVIIPVYKVSEQVLRKCIESVINQTFRDIEIILVDDGSPDECGRICDEYAVEDARIKVIHKENGGVSSARNIGLKFATGRFISFVDADDYVSNNIYDVCIKFQEKYNADLVIFGFNNGENISSKKVKTMDNSQTAKAIAGKYPYVMGYLWNKLFIKEKITNSNIRFDEDLAYCEDSYFCQQYAFACSKIICIPDVLYNYTLNYNSVTQTKMSSKKLTVFEAYKRILDFCSNRYNDLGLIKLLYANYYSHYIRNLRRIKNELSMEERKEFGYVYKFVKDNFNRIITNRFLKFRLKVLAIYLLLFMKNKI